MARTNKVNTSNSDVFKHRTSIGENGELLYDAPIVIQNQDDMKNYGITDKDCRYLHFGTSQKLRVYFFKTTSRSFAEYQWEYINNLHSSSYLATRCMIPGRRKAYVKCKDTNKCSACPYGRTPETKEAAVVSWDGLIETGFESVSTDSVEGPVIAKATYEELREYMDAEDPRISQAFEAKELFGASVKQIAKELQVSEPRVYQLIARAKVIGKEYQKEKSDL